MKVAFSSNGWDDYLFWQTTDGRILAWFNNQFTASSRTPRKASVMSNTRQRPARTPQSPGVNPRMSGWGRLKAGTRRERRGLHSSNQNGRCPCKREPMRLWCTTVVAVTQTELAASGNVELCWFAQTLEGRGASTCKIAIESVHTTQGGTMPDVVNDILNGAEFEASVYHVAQQLYRHSNCSGSIMLDGRERDNVIDTGTELIVVEATLLRTLAKTRGDLSKSIDLVKILKKSGQYAEYNFRIMLVTGDEPTADQSEWVRLSKAGCPKEIISFTTLFSRLFNARHYIRIRGDHAFGSVRDPADEKNYKVPQSVYIPTALSTSGTGASINASGLAEKLSAGGRYIVYGDYGSGKSMTLRDIYFRARDKFTEGVLPHCPVYLNLREHIAQTQPDEALYRHADKIGFPEPHSLIAAWRAGFVMLFLDGFDELTPPQFASSVANLRQARRFAVEIVRRFIEQTPASAPVIIAGRENYFDGREEARIALGYGDSAQEYDLAGFTDQDIQRFLKTKDSKIPSWLPTRPLLLGYLANAGQLRGQDQLLSLDPAGGWDMLLQRVCEREVNQIWGVGFESGDLRLYIEALASQARKSLDGRGLEDSGLRGIFRTVFGHDADEPANLLTRRLPGLGAVPGRPGAREFIDADFADAAASGDIIRYVRAPFGSSTLLENVIMPLGDLGRNMALSQLQDAEQKVPAALRKSSQSASLAVTTADLLSLLIDLQIDYSGAPLCIQDVHFESIVVDPEVDFSRITLRCCTISTVELGMNKDRGNAPRFEDCVIDRFEGAVSSQDVPAGVLIGSTSVENYAAYSATNDAVMNTKLPESVKVLLTILRKLFLQRGTGRQYSALRRGLPPQLVRYVDPIIARLKTNGLAADAYLDRRTILIPNRAHSADALAIINGPNTSIHPLIESIRGL